MAKKKDQIALDEIEVVLAGLANFDDEDIEEAIVSEFGEESYFATIGISGIYEVLNDISTRLSGKVDSVWLDAMSFKEEPEED